MYIPLLVYTAPNRKMLLCFDRWTIQELKTVIAMLRNERIKRGWDTRRRRKADKAWLEVNSGCDLCVCVHERRYQYVRACTCIYLVHLALLKTGIFSLWTPGYVALFMASAYLEISTWKQCPLVRNRWCIDSLYTGIYRYRNCLFSIYWYILVHTSMKRSY